jgi:hypothetical protein
MTTKNLAYLDPGSAGILVQMLIGGMAAAAVSVKLFWRRLRDLFRPRGKSDLDR